MGQVTADATGRGRRVKTRNERILKGIARHRRDYDRRRRTDPPDAEARDYMAIVRRDPCSYCGGFCGQMAADHIVSAKAGGRNVWDNYTAAGRPCNAAKRERPLLHFLLERAA